MSSPLTPCLIIVDDKFVLCVSAYPVSRLSVMHQQGAPFPKVIQQEYDNQDKAIIGLQALQSYYDKKGTRNFYREESDTKKSKELEEKIAKSPFKFNTKDNADTTETKTTGREIIAKLAAKTRPPELVIKGKRRN